MAVLVFGVAALTGAVTFLDPGIARACGGFFCDRPAAANPVPVIAQAAENVVFALDRDPVTGAGVVEAHIQIKYAGAADQFSWIVPTSSLPVVDLGSDVLFQIIEPKTRPSFTTQFTVDGTCKVPGGGSSFGCAGSGASGTSAERGGADGGIHQAPTVDVSFQGNVGPYEIVVIRSDDATALERWLTDHAYFVSPAASEIIAAYVATRSYFVALRLQAGRDVSEIQPIVLKLTAEEGCLPLRLTAIAATPDVRINVWVLGAARAVPINYEEFTPNLARLDWFGNGANYDKLVSEGANEAHGNAFIAEYAQPTAAAATWFTVPDNAVTQLAAARSPLAFITNLRGFGLVIGGRVVEVLRDQMPEPATLVAQGITEAQFYGAMPTGLYLNNPNIVFDSVAAAAQMDTDVLQPMRKMRTLVEGHAHLTRLATFISADEMIKDPLFVTNRTLPAISNVHTAMAHVACGNEEFAMCDAPVRLDVEGGRSVWFRSIGNGSCASGTQSFDRGALDVALPAAERVWLRDADSEGTLTTDNSGVIDAVLVSHNGAVRSSGGGDCAVVARRTGISSLGALVLLAALAVARSRRR